MTVLFDTARLPAQERGDALRAAFAAESAQQVEIVGSARLRHRHELVGLGPDVRLHRSVGSPLHITRTERHVRRDAPEVLALGLQRRGRALLSTGGTEQRPRLGQLDCLDTTRPYEYVERGVAGRDVLMVSNRQAGVSVDTVRAAAPALARSPVYELVREHVAGLFDATSELPDRPRLLAGQASVALVRALLLTAAGDVAGRGALEDSLEVRVDAYIDAHLGDRDLTVERIAAAHNVSKRHLYNVWAQAGRDRSLNQWIIGRRLDRARQQLAALDPAQASIGSVARRHGFADASHFSRRFREAFGESPKEWRSTRAEALWHGAPGRGAAPDPFRR